MKDKSFFRYLIELAIVIAGVTIAFWLNTRAEDAKEKAIVKNYYQELHSDLKADQKYLNGNIRNNKRKIEKMERAIGFYMQGNPDRDSIFIYSSEIGNYFFFNPKDITYRTMINSGDMKLIDDLDLKSRMVALYDRYQIIDEFQQNHLKALDENFFPKYVYMVDYIEGKVLQPIEEDILVKNYFAWVLNELNLHIQYYESAFRMNQKLDSLVMEAY